MAGLKDAGHTEDDPNTPVPLLVLAACSIDSTAGTTRLSGELHINIKPGSLASRIYQQSEITEKFNCNYELNPVYRGKLEAAGLKVSGESDNGGARIIELSGFRFFLATGFLPQLSSDATHPHPLIMAYLEAAANI